LGEEPFDQRGERGVVLVRGPGRPEVGQLEDNRGALDVEIGDEHLLALEEVTAVELGFPHDFLNSALPRKVIYGDATIEPRR